jgi:hypothetical protein
MKIYFSEIFNDYFFEWSGSFWLLYPDKSLDPSFNAWLDFQFVKPTDLKLVCEVE